MQSTDSPKKISIPFARDGDKRVIPNTSQIGITAGAASYPTGFPPQTFIAKENGGIPPAGVDFNGLFNDITTLDVWTCAGGLFKYDAALSAQINGYPKGAQILSADATGVWVSTVENNTSNPDTGGAGWVRSDLSSLLQPTGASRVFAADGQNLQTHLNRGPSNFGRLTLADLPKFARTVDQYRYDTKPPIYVVGFGSSVGVGATLPDASTQAPVAYFTQQLRNFFDPASLLNVQVSNQSVNGSIISDFPAAWAAMLTAGITPTIVYLAYGMNDQSVAQFNSGQTAPGFDQGFEAAMELIRSVGADVVVATSPHASVVNHPELFAMPPSVPQTYPTSVAAPVSPEQLLPPASQSYAIGDISGSGINTTGSVRALAINRKMRYLAAKNGCVLLDVELFWNRTIAANVAAGMTMAQAEQLMFNVGETVHPNLYGHQNSYWLASIYAWRSIGYETAQRAAPRNYSGYLAINPTAANAPAAVLDVHIPYPNMTIPPVKFWARTGVADVNSIKTEELALAIEPTNGDVLMGDLTASGGELRFIRVLDPTHTLTSYLQRRGTAYGVVYTETIEGNPNTTIASPYTTRAPFPANSVGKSLVIAGTNSGIGTSPQVNRYTWTTNGSTITLTAAGTTGSAVFTVAVSGLALVVTPIADNTNFKVTWEALS